MMGPDHFYHILGADFLAFLAKAFETLEPGKVFKPNWHHRKIQDELARCQSGDERRLVVNLPPRCFKSTMISVAWVAFRLGQDPRLKVVVVSYTDRLAEKLSNDTRKIMESAFYRRTFPKTVLTKSTNMTLETDQGGKRIATTINGAVTGMGGDLIVIDDPHSASETGYETSREAVKRFYDQNLSTRLDDVTAGVFVLVMQRLHPDDLAGHLLARGGWRQLKLPAIAPDDAVIDLGGGVTHTVRAGDLLHPEHLPQSFLDEQKLIMGPAAFQAQYQQEPIPAGGYIVKQEWIKRYDQLPRDGDGEIIQSLDTASKTGLNNDYSVMTTWLLLSGNHYLLDVCRERLDYPTLKRKVIELSERHLASRVLIEDHVIGTALISELERTTVPAIGIRPKGSKKERLETATGLMESGKVWLPKQAPWLADFESELFGFPATKHDDQVDSASQYLNWFRERPPPSSFSYSWNDGTVTDDIAKARGF